MPHDYSDYFKAILKAINLFKITFPETNEGYHSLDIMSFSCKSRS